MFPGRRTPDGKIDTRRIEVIDDDYAAVLRRIPPGERVRRGLEMADFARQMIRASVRQMHPDWDEQRVATEVMRRFSGA